MYVRVLFFGATYDAAGTRELQLQFDDGKLSREVFDEVLSQHPKLRTHKLLFSVNQEYASGKEILTEGDELAIFTAVSGG